MNCGCALEAVDPGDETGAGLVREVPFASMVRGCASRSLVARVATPFKRVRDTVSPAPGLWTEGEMRKGVDRRRRVRAHLERVNLFAAGIDVGSRSHFVAVPEDLEIGRAHV